MNIEWYKQVLVTVIMIKIHAKGILLSIKCFVRFLKKFVKTVNVCCSLIFSAFKRAKD